MEWADWIRGKESGTQGTVDQDSKNYLSIKSGMTVNGNMRHSRGTIASSNFSSGTAGYSLDAGTGNIETNSDLVCGNIHVKAATDDVNLSGATGNAIIGVSTSAQHLAFDANEIMSKSDATTAGTLYLQHNGGTLAVGAGAAGTFRVGSSDGTHQSVASFSTGTHAAPSITFNGDTDTGFFKESANTIGSTGNFTMSKTGSSATLTVSTFADAPGTESIIVLRSADNTLASPALRDSGDNLGEIHFAGHDGTDYAVGAKISVAASAATGDNDMGATIKFQTTPDGSQTPTTRLAIDHVGRVYIAAASSDTTVDLDGVSGALIVGSVDGGDSHVAISNQTIQSKDDATTARNLYLNNTGGEVHIGNAATEGKISILDNGIYRFGDNTDTYINIKQGAAGSTGQIRWTYNQDDIATYATMGIVYDDRATDGFHINTGYPITIDSTTKTTFSVAGSVKGWVEDGGNWYFGTTLASAVQVDPDGNDVIKIIGDNGTQRPYMSIWNRDASGNLDRKGYIGFPHAANDASQLYIRADQGYLNLGSGSGSHGIYLTGNTFINGTGGWITNYGNVLKIDNADGYTHIGCMNTNGTHIYSERARVYLGMYNAAYFFANTAAWMPISDNAKNLGYSSSSYRWDNVYATSGTVNTSDQRDKTDIVDIDLGLDFIKSLRPVNYRWNLRSGYEGTRTHMGFISQEVATALGNEASNRGVWINNPEETADVDGMGEKTFPEGQGLRYHQLIAPIVKGIQELEARVASLEG
jgi:hypothetical protein